MSSSRLLAGAALVCAALATALTSPLAAHHSFAAIFEMNTTREIEGKITKIVWSNPHIKFYVDAGKNEVWEIEAGPVNLLSSMKIEKNTLAVGDAVRVFGNPGKRNARTMWVSNVRILRSRTELLAAPGAKQRWPDTIAVGIPGPLTQPGKPVTDKKVTFFRTWATLSQWFPKPRGEATLTPAGQRAQARYDIDKKVITDCEVPGMPFAMMSPYPMELRHQGDRLQFLGEAYDLRRTIYLKAPATPPAPSPLGLSVGRIDGNVLTVETSRINYHSFGDLGPAQSNQSHVVERFILSADGLKLDYDVTVTDPVNLAKPWSWGGEWHAWSDRKRGIWNCGKEL